MRVAAVCAAKRGTKIDGLCLLKEQEFVLHVAQHLYWRYICNFFFAFFLSLQREKL